MHRLSELQGDDILVLHLSRGEHCPRERQHHREMLRFHEWCSLAFTELVSCCRTPSTTSCRLKIGTGAHWTFLADEDLEVQRHFDIHEYTDTHHDHAGVPHTLILSPGLRIEKVYVGYWFWGRPSPEQLWVDLQELCGADKDDFDPTTPEARAKWEASQARRPPERMSRFRRAVWLFPVAFAAHVLEEAPGFTAWARRHGSSRYTEDDFIRNNALGLAMTIVGTRSSRLGRRAGRPMFSYFAIVLTQQAVFNTLFHSGTTVAYREYSPGLVTALAGFLPVW